jgi:hypothetical protein
MTASLAVAAPKLSEVLDRVTGRTVTAKAVIGNVTEQVLSLRNDIMERIVEGRLPRYACSLCGQSVRLNGMIQPGGKRFYFRHVAERGDCPIDTGAALTREQIDAIRYNGAKESERHLQMKDWIAQSIAADAAFSDLVVEGSWKGRLTDEIRRPDVQVQFRGMRLAFEVQLSSTYLDVIVGRRDFYRRQGALVVWVFADFEEGMHKLTHEDLFFHNHQNALVVTEQSLKASLERGKFILECIWRLPLSATDPALVSDLQRRLLSFDELELDLQEQRAFYVNFAEERAKLVTALRRPEPGRCAGLMGELPDWYWSDEAEVLRGRFEESWLQAVSGGGLDDEAWEELGFRFEEHDLPHLPSSPWALPETILKVLYSLRRNRPMGYNFDKLIQVLHEVLPRRDRTQAMPYLEYVDEALRISNRLDKLRQAPNYRRWVDKVNEHNALVRDGCLEDVPLPRLEDIRLIEFLFPKLAGASGRLPTLRY